MIQADYDAFCEIVVGFAEIKGKSLSAPAIKIYWQSMQHWSLAEFRAAAQHLLRTCAFMPTPKDFEDLRKAGKPTASEAWDLVLQHCKGAYREGAGLDGGGPIDTAVSGLGGYRALAFHDSEKLHFMQRQFAERFEEADDVMSTRQRLPAITDQRTHTTVDSDGFRKLGEIRLKDLSR